MLIRVDVVVKNKMLVSAVEVLPDGERMKIKSPWIVSKLKAEIKGKNIVDGEHTINISI